MIETQNRPIAIWDTSAVNRLACLDDVDHLVERMNKGLIHCIPFCVLEEIAADPNERRRLYLIDVCRMLKGCHGTILPSPSVLITEAIKTHYQTGKIGASLLEPRENWEAALELGLAFDNDLARIQSGQNRTNQAQMEQHFARSIGQFDYCFSLSANPMTANDVVAYARTSGVMVENVRHFCESVLQRPVDSDYAGRLARDFPPVTAVIYAFLLGHYYRFTALPQRKVQAIDLFAAAYLPLCNKFVSDDRHQQHVLRAVTKCHRLRTEVVWFGDYKLAFL